ncbi:MAG: CAP domain-containing protein, partial [Acidobacteriota bacterium]
MRAAVLVLGLAVSACGVDDPPIQKREQAIGVPDNGFPSWEERVILVLTNRARVDPAAESAAVCGGSCATYPASKPLDYLAAAGRAARFQTTSLIKAKSGLMHESVCELVSNLGSLYPDSCDGSPSCACVGGAASCVCTGSAPYCTAPGGLTAWNARVSRFGVSAAGENIAAGYSDPVAAFNGWVKSSGHWQNINNANHRRIGTGFFAGTGGCWSAMYAQVFTGGTAVTGLAGGAHHPKTGSATTSFKLWANYTSAGAPQLATVNIDGTCQPMTLERGTGANGTFLLQQTLAAGCHRYYFYFRDETGAITSYPSTGSYGLGVASSACADYSSDRPSLGAGCGGCTSAAECDDKNPCTQDTCVANTCQSAPVAGCCSTA